MRLFATILWPAVGATVMLGALGPVSHPDHASQLAKEIEGYKTWTKANTKPIHMEPYISMLCRGPGPEHSKENPHDLRWFTVYSRNPWENGLPRDVHVGTVIVKEKLKSPADLAPELMTVMVKRERGFDKKNGDWEYFVVDHDGKISQDNVASCQSCHRGVADYGYLFPIHDGRG